MGAPFLYDHHVNRIREALWRPDQGAAIMIGSGFSRNARPLIADQKKMPLWSELGEGLRRELGLGADPGALAQGLTRTAECYRQDFGDGALGEFVERIIRDEDFSPGDLHKQLLSLPWADVFTTNFDTLLERAARSVASRRYGVISDQRKLVGRRGPSIIKLHGTVGDPRSMTITEDHFRRYPREKAAFVNTVRQSMIEKVFLLLGFSGDDPNFLAWAGWVRDELGSSAHKIYLCSWLRAGPSERGWGAESNIVPIDLSQVPGAADLRDDERHEFSIKWFLDRLQEGEPPPAYAWPSRSSQRRARPRRQILDPQEVIFVKRTAGIAELYSPDRYPDLEAHVDPLREELSKFRWRQRSGPLLNGGAEADAYDRLFDPDGDGSNDNEIRRGDAAALFMGAISREAALLYEQRHAYPGWLIFPIGNRERDGVVRHATVWAGTLEAILAGGSDDVGWQRAQEVLRVLSGDANVLQACRARLFCFLRELALRLGLCLSPIGPRWPHLAKLIERVIQHEGAADPEKPWSPGDLDCVIAAKNSRNGLWAAEHETQACVNGAINLLVALLEDARDIGDARRFSQLARSLTSISRNYPALDLDWRVQHARLVMSACLDLPPESGPSPSEMQTQAPPSDVIRWVRRAAANAAFDRLSLVEADCRRALEILSSAQVSVDQRIWLQSREAWIVFACRQATRVVGEERCRQDDAYGNAFHPELLRDRLDRLSGTTDPYAELRVVQSARDGNPFLLWRLLLESGHLPDSRAPDSHAAFHAAAVRFEELDRPLLARSAAIALMTGMSPNDLVAPEAYPLKVAKAGLAHENVEAVAELADFVCAAARRLAAMTHLSEGTWRRARLRTIALLLSQLSLAFVESDDTHRQAAILDAAAELAATPGTQHEELLAIVARLLRVMSRDQVLERMPRLFALLLYASRKGVQPSAEPFLVLSKRPDLKGQLRPSDPALETCINVLLGVDRRSRRQAVVMSADSALRAVAARRIVALQHLGALTAEQNEAFETVLRAEAEQAFGHDHETIALEEFEWLDIALARHRSSKEPEVWARIIAGAQSYLSGAHGSLDRLFEQKFQPVLDAKLHIAHPRKWPDDDFAHALVQKFERWADDVLGQSGAAADAASPIFVSKLVGEFILPWVLRRRDASIRQDMMRSIQTRLEKLVEIDLPFEGAFVKITISGPSQERGRIIGRLLASVRSADPKRAQSAIDAIYEWCKRAKDLLDGKTVKGSRSTPAREPEDMPSRDDLLRDRDMLVDAVRALLLEPHHPNAIMAIECFSRLYVELGLGEDTRQKQSLAIYVEMFRRSLARPRNDVPPHRARALAALLALLEENIGGGKATA